MELLGMGGKRHPAQQRTPAGGFFLYPAWTLSPKTACKKSRPSRSHSMWASCRRRIACL